MVERDRESVGSSSEIPRATIWNGVFQSDSTSVYTGSTPRHVSDIFPYGEILKKLEHELKQLVVANRILAKEDVVDAYGHVSFRHPDNPERMFMSRSLPPDLVEHGDLMEFHLDGEPVEDRRQPYLERFIHCGIYQARPDVHAVVHAHAEAVLPFGITDVPLGAVVHSGSFIGSRVPVWDIADKFGDTTLLVTNLSQAKNLAESLGDNSVALMRGHGFAAAASSLIEVVRLSVYLPRNARVQLAAMQLGKFKPLTEGEIAARAAVYKPHSVQTWRAWHYWANRAGCGDIVGDKPPAIDEPNTD